ncbi:carbamoyl phosphate synthase large subunit [Halobacillus salinarum]|uniref:carbamoyl-phosphate synthase (ammonia) n=1 Tax=Halobacillus salinarum TaxID=2932257 RepID=A0ABY4EPT3_9BACI|nr:carbamoyl phosphate synthase large subunit [Halobacillus salinarum]
MAKMATKIALGYPLDELQNPLTGNTYASFEPALDYVVVKFPRWPFDKFPDAERKLGTKMKATGEVMAIDRSLEGAFQKAVASLDQTIPKLKADELMGHLQQPTDLRYFALLELLRMGETVENLQTATGIDLFYLHTLKNLTDMEQQIQSYSIDQLPQSLLKQAKLFSFTDAAIAQLMNVSEEEITQLRKEYKITPSYKMVDTCAAEFEAATNYVYATYAGVNEITPLPQGKKALIVGSGPIRIGQGVEFDYSAVKAIESLKKLGWTTVMINNNPETVSTDYETADRLYFEPVTAEVIASIVEHEQIDLVFTQYGGQTAINIAEELEKLDLPLAGVKVDVLEALEDRERFYAALKELDIPHIPGSVCHTFDEAVSAASQYTYPLLCRPSYVIGGQGMMTVNKEQELKQALIQTDERHYPIVLDQFMTGKEVEVDLAADGKQVFIPEIIEHIEPAGVHSGDSMAVFPSQLPDKVKEKIYSFAEKIVNYFNYKGIMNIQFLLTDDAVYVLEVNPRASRTVPIVSKVSGTSLIDLATKILVNELPSPLGDLPEPVFEHIAVKYPLFSFHAMPELDHKLGPNMKSTGEGMCIGSSVEEAMSKVFAALPNVYLDKDVCFIEDYELDVPMTTLGFKDWLETKEASIYVNTAHTEEAKQKRVQALKYGIEVFSEKDTFKAYLDGLNAKGTMPVSLPGSQKEGVHAG